MADQRLRQLERAWSQSESVNDEAALIAERLRTGVINTARLSLAQTLEHEAARLLDRLAHSPDAATTRRMAMLEVWAFAELHEDDSLCDRCRRAWTHPEKGDEMFWISLMAESIEMTHNEWARHTAISLWRNLWSTRANHDRHFRDASYGWISAELHRLGGPTYTERSFLLMRTHLVPWLVGHGAPGLEPYGTRRLPRA